MTMISRLGFKPTRKQNIKSDLLQTTEEITIVIPVKDNQNGIDLFLNEFFTTHSANNFPKEERKYRLGLKEGDWKVWDESGELLLTTTYERGEVRKMEGVKVK